MTSRALALAKEDLLAMHLCGGRFRVVEPPSRGIEFRGGWEIQHVLHLSHVTDLDPIENVHALLDGMNLIAVKVGCPLFKLGKVLDRTQASLRTVNLLIEDAAQADGI